ncbi:EamA family transporter RarD [Pseudonocardia endophytica]|uniref:Chloramphenicol-sensitive protein RarD n=1 Tax=Pseudonocardia endophytica TaxID=401976 RepID=A0A4R1HDW1_PSEEN|nr:EamA family transporter RarD [Pseudonocardia endophytica]TCK20247.1 chloramphenicol-sensitive protein RarD [Pseudonocardia endophytica]
MRVDDDSLDRRGVALGVGAYAVWGLFPAFWALLSPASPPEVLAHRILWTAVLMSVVLTVLRGWRDLRTLGLRGWLNVAAAAVFIAVNWGVFIYSVSIGHVVEAALGYYMTPLVSVLLAVLVLREKVGPAPWVALALATAAIVVIAVGAGAAPWLSLVLAVTFGIYGLIKKTIPLPATASLTGEGIVLAPIAAAVVLAYQLSGSGTFVGLGPWHTLLMLAAAPVTALPLLLYGAAARRIPLATLGVLMYLNPTLQFLWGVLVVGEQMPTSRWIGFVLVWLALTVFTVDIVRRARRRAPVQPVRSTV